MIIYKQKNIFSRETGKIIGFDYTKDYEVCDYSGRKLSNDSDKPTFLLGDACGSEEWWYYLEFFIGKKRLDTTRLVEDPFVFLSSGVQKILVAEFCGLTFPKHFNAQGIKEIAEVQVHAGLKPFETDKILSLNQMFLECRVRTIKKLLADGMTEKQLQLTFDE